MAGSRREHLAADNLKIYITVKLSSAMDVYQGFDVNDRSKFNVAMPPCFVIVKLAILQWKRAKTQLELPVGAFCNC